MTHMSTSYQVCFIIPPNTALVVLKLTQFAHPDTTISIPEDPSGFLMKIFSLCSIT